VFNQGIALSPGAGPVIGVVPFKNAHFPVVGPVGRNRIGRRLRQLDNHRRVLGHAFRVKPCAGGSVNDGPQPEMALGCVADAGKGMGTRG